MAFYFVNTIKDIFMKEENEEDYRNINICRFCEKNIESEKVRDQCHLAGKNRGVAYSECIINVTQKQSNLSHLYFTTLVITSVICFLKS